MLELSIENKHNSEWNTISYSILCLSFPGLSSFWPSEKLELISKYVDLFLRPKVDKGSAYIKDTKDFIMKVEGQWVPKEAVFVTVDMVSLYADILHGKVCLLAEKTFEARVEKLPLTYFIM